jgi:quercetin dioxygenase-like cupin family protein
MPRIVAEAGAFYTAISTRWIAIDGCRRWREIVASVIEFEDQLATMWPALFQFLYRLSQEDHFMPRLIEQPTKITAAGNKPKLIEEFVGRVNSKHEALSVARMKSPGGWVEPGQRPEFLEVSVVLAGMLRVESEGGVHEVRAGQAVVCEPGEWVRYSTPEAEGAEYVAVCLSAFSPATVHRDE